MLNRFKTLVARLKWAARRWLPGLFIRVTRKDIDNARMTLKGLSEEDIEEGRTAVKRAIQVSREREGSPPPGK